MDKEPKKGGKARIIPMGQTSGDKGADPFSKTGAPAPKPLKPGKR